jgi:phosphoribosylanthranilate isomerase
LHPGNVREAIDQVGPFGLDVCSGVRSGGSLDASRLLAFFKAAGY